MAINNEPLKYQFYGRRYGRKLKDTRASMLDDMLPAFEITPGTDITFGFAPKDMWLEIGFGNGEHLIEQAKQNPAIGFIGAEPFMNGVSALLMSMKQDNVSNIRIFPNDARILMDALPDASVGRCFLLHSDPWPKKKHHRRRVIQPETLDTLARILKPGAELRVSTDDVSLAVWSLDHIWHHPAFEWTARSAQDWRVRPADWYETRYENKGLEQNRPPFYLRFIRT